MGSTARWLSWLKRLTSNEEIPSSNLGRAFLQRFKISTTQNFSVYYDNNMWEIPTGNYIWPNLQYGGGNSDAICLSMAFIFFS